MHGWMIGWHNPNSPGQGYGNGGDNRTFNMLTVRYRINDKRNNGAGWTDFPGNCGSQGICDNASSNLPLNSAHPAGVMVTLADASVRLLTAQMDLPEVAKLATRDDGQIAQLPD
jgi:hypothetical protein